MPSSISNSDRTDANPETARQPTPVVGDALLAAVLMVAALIAMMEAVLSLRGFHPTAVDDEPTWIVQRHRASTLGPRALILVGASRIQTGIDIDALRDVTGLEPVQLAIDGSSFTPILKELAADPTITGTIMVSYQSSAVPGTNGVDIASRYSMDYEATRDRLDSIDFRSVEYRLDGAVRSHLRSFADGARPLTTLFARILTFDPSPQYATFLPDRSRLANYSNVDVTETYYTRVLRELGGDFTIPAGADLRSVDDEIRKRIAAAPAIPEEAFRAGTEKIAGHVRQIQARGGRVLFVEFPTSGLITEMEDHACPRARCWDRFIATTGAPHLAFSDVPSLHALPVPDGSHIDFRNRRKQTLALVELLNLARHPSTNSR